MTDPPAGRFAWRYPGTPRELKQLWSPSAWTELTKGAVMAFEETSGMTVDGEAGPAVWKALINAVIHHQRSDFGYTFVMVSEQIPESIHVWHDGKIVVHGPVNTGISVAPTALGTYAVYEHLETTTMSGINPDGDSVPRPRDPVGELLQRWRRAPWLHPGFIWISTEPRLREMPYDQAHEVWPYTPVGTIVNLT